MPAFFIPAAITFATTYATSTLVGTALLTAALKAAAISGGLSFLASTLFKPSVPEVGGGAAAQETLQAETFPARWILGEARTGGALFLYRELVSVQGKRNYGTSGVGYYIAHGQCDSCVGVWIDGDYVSLERTLEPDGWRLTPPVDSRYYRRITIYEYFSADGNAGAAVRDDLDDWTTDHQLPGMSWLYVKLNQPNYGVKVERRFWKGFPTLQFRVRGLRLTWPGQTTPRWTDNAAAIRYFWLTQRRAVPETLIDAADFRAAYDLCDESVTVPLPPAYADYESTARRYSVNGIIRSGDDAETVEAQLDYAWQGYAVEAGGIFYFRPGASRTPTLTITPDDIEAVVSVEPAPPLQQRINAVSFGLRQSREHDWLELTLPEYVDADAVNRDRRKLPTSLASLEFITSAVQALRLTAQLLRRARATATYTMRVKPYSGFANMRLIPTDRVLVTCPQYGLTNTRLTILKTVTHDDWSTTLVLTEDPADLYNDKVELPTLVSRVVSLPRPPAVPVPTGLDVEGFVETLADGSYLNLLRVTWEPLPVSHTEIRYRRRDAIEGAANIIVDSDPTYLATQGGARIAASGPDEWTSVFGEGEAAITGITAGAEYEIQARHIARDGDFSDWSDVLIAESDGDLAPPGPVIDLTVEAVVGGFDARWTNPADADFDVVEVWTTTTTAATDLSSAILQGEIRGTRFAVFDIPTPVALRVFVRARDRAGNLGPLQSAAVTTLARDARGRGDFYVERATPSWSDVAASAAANHAPRISDTVTQYNIAADWSEVRFWDGDNWITYDPDSNSQSFVPGLIVGDRIAANTIRASHLKADSITADKIAANAIESAAVFAPGVIGRVFAIDANTVSGPWDPPIDTAFYFSTGKQRTITIAVPSSIRALLFDLSLPDSSRRTQSPNPGGGQPFVANANGIAIVSLNGNELVRTPDVLAQYITIPPNSVITITLTSRYRKAGPAIATSTGAVSGTIQAFTRATQVLHYT